MRRLLTIITLLLAAPVGAEQNGIQNAIDSHSLFWSEVYPNSGWTLYCGEYFETRRKIAVEPLYSMSWVADVLACGTTQTCRDSSERFNRIEADMHNLYPALKNIVQARENFHFGMIAGEFRDFFECDFEYEPSKKLAEPRPVARGNIARALIYMHTGYDLPLNAVNLTMLQKWNSLDPPSKDEIRRNNVIEKLQGTRNPFIDDYLLADEIRLQTEDKPPARDAQIIKSF